MDVSFTKQDDRIVITLSGELDTAASQHVESELAPIYSYDNYDFLIDCSGLTYISSSGLRILLSIYKFARRTGHKVLLSHVNDSVKEVFSISGFLQLFTIEP